MSHVDDKRPIQVGDWVQPKPTQVRRVDEGHIVVDVGARVNGEEAYVWVSMDNVTPCDPPQAPTHATRDDWSSFVARFLAWKRETFPRGTPRTAAVHLHREAKEVCDAIDEGKPVEAIAEEFGDCLVLALSGLDLLGVDPLAVVEEKLAKNKTRTWGKPDADGVIEHVREAVVAPPATTPDWTRTVAGILESRAQVAEHAIDVAKRLARESDELNSLRTAVGAFLEAHDAVRAYRGTVPEVRDGLAERRLITIDDMRAVFDGTTVAQSARVAEDHVGGCNTCPYSMEFSGGRWHCVHGGAPDGTDEAPTRGNRIVLSEDPVVPPPEWCPLRKGPTLVTLRTDAKERRR